MKSQDPWYDSVNTIVSILYVFIYFPGLGADEA